MLLKRSREQIRKGIETVKGRSIRKFRKGAKEVHLANSETPNETETARTNVETTGGRQANMATELGLDLVGDATRRRAGE